MNTKFIKLGISVLTCIALSGCFDKEEKDWLETAVSNEVANAKMYEKGDARAMLKVNDKAHSLFLHRCMSSGMMLGVLATEDQEFDPENNKAWTLLVNGMKHEGVPVGRISLTQQNILYGMEKAKLELQGKTLSWKGTIDQLDGNDPRRGKIGEASIEFSANCP